MAQNKYRCQRTLYRDKTHCRIPLSAHDMQQRTCPNMGECWGKGTATFMIGGDICTRCCKFCNTQTGKPMPLDPQEPVHVAESIALMKLSHAVVTSVDRDDLAGFGSRPLGANNPRNQTPQPGYDR